MILSNGKSQKINNHLKDIIVCEHGGEKKLKKKRERKTLEIVHQTRNKNTYTL